MLLNQAPVVQMVDSTIQWINLNLNYPMDKFELVRIRSTRGHSTINRMRPVCGRHLIVWPF